jgi:hypothetical protein
MTGIIIAFIAGVLVGAYIPSRLKSLWDYLKSSWGE